MPASTRTRYVEELGPGRWRWIEVVTDECYTPAEAFPTWEAAEKDLHAFLPQLMKRIGNGGRTGTLL